MIKQKRHVWNAGTKGLYSEEYKEKLRMAKLGRKLPQETKDKIGLKSRGNKHRLGKTPWNKDMKGFGVISAGTIMVCQRCNKDTPRTAHCQKFCKPCYHLLNHDRNMRWLDNPINRKIFHKRNNLSRERQYKIYPEKKLARYLASQIPINPECEICGDNTRLHRHHWRYDKPILFNTLCVECHSVQHIKDFKNSRYVAEEMKLVSRY